jgi:hypothetical protein
MPKHSLYATNKKTYHIDEKNTLITDIYAEYMLSKETSSKFPHGKSYV